MTVELRESGTAPNRRRVPFFVRIGLRSGWVVAALSLCAGCGEEEGIVVQRVARNAPPPPPAIDGGSKTPAAATSTEARPGRLLGVLLPHADETWVFKVLGPQEAVDPHVAAVREFVSTVRFAGAEPQWTLPAGWRERPGDPRRYTTFVPPDGAPPIELAVSRMSAGQDVADNVNRWRGQVKLSPLAPTEAVASAEMLDTPAGKAVWVDLKGSYSASSGMPPFAQGMPAGHPPLLPGEGADVGPLAAPTDVPVKYELPAGWTPAKLDVVSLLAFAASSGDEKIRVTISEAGGDLLSNVNRWRGQLALPELQASDLEAALTKLKIDGRSADFIELLGTAAGARQSATLAVIVPKSDGSSWFVKLTGDAPLAARERDRFVKFCQSLRFDR